MYTSSGYAVIMLLSSLDRSKSSHTMKFSVEYNSAIVDTDVHLHYKTATHCTNKRAKYELQY